jgi:hypothetical protein
MAIEFKFLTAAERAELPKDDFGDPDRMLFPILTQEDVDTVPNRLLPDMETIKKRIIEIATRKGFTLPDALGAAALSEFSSGNSSDAETASFASQALDSEAKTSDGEYVLRTGKIFEAGAYPDKKFEMSPEELCEAVSQFKPVDIDLEHMPTILDGKLGKLEAVALGSDGWSMVGTVRLPKWLDEQLGDADRKVSATWDRETKKLKKLALVRNPRVKDASLFAAFTADELRKNIGSDNQIVSTNLLVDTLTKFFETTETFATKKTWDGASAIQQMHDTAARCGAICSETNDQKKSAYFKREDESEFVSADEAKFIQQMHDTAVRGGARCSFIKEGADRCVPYNDNNAAELSVAENKENKEMVTIKEVIAFFKGLPEDTDLSEDNSAGKAPVATEDKTVENGGGEKAAATAAAATASAPAPKVEVKVEEDKTVKNSEPSEREKQLESQLKDLRLKDVKNEAEKFADAKIKEGLAVPHERPALIALFTQATLDDESNETKLEFKAGDEDKQVSRVEALDALYSVRKPHGLTEEKIAAEKLGVLVTNSGDEDENYLAEAEEQAKKYAERRNKGKTK